ncbi:hypothetical protein OA92_14210 [Marinomonas sp. SBI22]|uniref:hypothetical protein n=1 Tax=unclassified Marinomonas TaxID=196814 RepID=UPI0007AF0598|nr:MULTISPECIES: hypothetical protein [unclassified Marinomonas]KZM41543.1 hypothetical protein OA92_14210 [Marinomonas sp. SBI22]KZM43379.1 hypothetical protein OA91_12415 [Marinomonas sp. SBI8L]
MVISLTKTWCFLIALILLALFVSPYVFLEWKSESLKREILEDFKKLRQSQPPPHIVHNPRYRKPSDMPQVIFPKAVVARTTMDMPNDHVVYFLTRKLSLSEEAQSTLSDIVTRYSNQRKILQGKIAVEVQLLAELSPSDAEYMQKVSDAAGIQADISTQVMRLYAKQQVEIYQLLTLDQIEELELIKHRFAQKMKARIAKDRTKGIFSFESGDIESNEIKSDK